MYILFPKSRIGQIVRSPFMKFLYYSTSFGCFLFLLTYATFEDYRYVLNNHNAPIFNKYQIEQRRKEARKWSSTTCIWPRTANNPRRDTNSNLGIRHGVVRSEATLGRGLHEIHHTMVELVGLSHDVIISGDVLTPFLRVLYVHVCVCWSNGGLWDTLCSEDWVAFYWTDVNLGRTLCHGEYLQLCTHYLFVPGKSFAFVSCFNYMWSLSDKPISWPVANLTWLYANWCTQVLLHLLFGTQFICHWSGTIILVLRSGVQFALWRGDQLSKKPRRICKVRFIQNI